ncbi:VanZ family protein [Clostridium sp. CCUG 7971]|uniref:VanZ family protein n=1 Tax=Clostridium sp. CCUG 7971 TaxID=2811414 RepID=UPI001ABB522E|nr:VanZ family protein [Clostridium sp. CCUG 7971]MBO3446045.1 VanZ family protein [Clostridium sp. CCUG 7971]
MFLFKYFLIPFLLIYTLLFFKFAKFDTNIKKILCYSFGIYICLVIGITIFPIPIQPEEIQLNITYNLGQLNNFIPLKTTYENLIVDMKNNALMASLKQIIGNIIMFIPVGFYAPILKKHIKLKEITIAGLIFSICIELTQFIINTIIGYNYRSVDIDDIILNVLGAIIGYLIFKVIYPMIKELIEKS